jgi:hypothetical protein
MRIEFPCDPTRIDLLFTMSENTHDASIEDDASELMFRGRIDDDDSSIRVDLRLHLVEPDGIEPTTSCLQSTRSPS